MNPLPSLDFLSTTDVLNFRPVEARIEQEIGKINYSEIDTTRIAPGADALDHGRPLAFTWGRRIPGARRLEYGYLTGHSDETIRNGSTIINKVTLRVMGAAFGMSDKRSRSWNGLTIPSIVRLVANEHRLNVVTDEHLVQWTEIRQDNESDWAFLCRLAKQIGWWIYLDATTLYVFDPDRIISRIMPILIDVDGSGAYKQHTDDSSLMGERKRVDRSVTAIVNGQRHVFSSNRVPVTGKALPTKAVKEEVEIEAETYAEAQALFEGIERNSAWYIERRLTAPGRADLRPLQPVVVRTPRVVQNNQTSSAQKGWEQYDGMWIVKSVESRLKFNRESPFSTEVVLVRDATGPSANTRQRKPTDRTKFETQPPTRLFNDQWAASWSK